MKSDFVSFSSGDKKVLVFSGVTVLAIIIWLISCIENMPMLFMLRFVPIVLFGFFASAIDLSTKRIPNKLVLAMLFGWVLISIPMCLVEFIAAIRFLTDSLLGFAFGGGLFLAVYLLSKKGLGGGDVKFMAAAGLYLGFTETLTVILYGTILAALTGVILILMKKIERKEPMPLAPFLFVGIMISAFIRGFQL